MSEFLIYLRSKHATNKRWVNEVLDQDATAIHLLNAENEAIERTFRELASQDAMSLPGEYARTL